MMQWVFYWLLYVICQFKVFFSFENRELGIFDVSCGDGFFVRIFWLGDLGGIWVLGFD